jgi:prepilin-type N-terminal cleavage/methylation domain-containing protein
LNKNNKLKGFTLVELIVVMAIFGILMAAVMQVITPLNKISKRASIQEANAAAVDNVKSYLESSIRYSECVEVCVGGLTDNTGKLLSKYTTDELSKKYGVSTVGGSGSAISPEDAAVVNFIDNHYANRTQPDLKQAINPLTGKVRMLKIDNGNGGKVSEYEYDFTAGYTYTNYLEADAKIDGKDYKKGEANPHPIRVNSTVKSVSVAPKSVINDVYYENYSFYIAPGYAQMQTIDKNEKNADKPSENKLKGFDTSDDTSDDYYAALEPVDKTAVNFSPDLFSLSIVTYKNDKNDAGEYTYRGTCDENDTEKYTAFQSPFALSNANMSLVNINSEFGTSKWETACYGPVRCNGKKAVYDKDTGAALAESEWPEYDPIKGQKGEVDPSTGAYTWGPIDENKDKNPDYRAITAEEARKINANDRLFVHPEVTGADSDDCIYFIYTVPDFK